jgi:hypothetical protein
MPNHTPRLTVVQSIRGAKRNVIGWQFICYTCHTKQDFKPAEYPLAVLTVEAHQCRTGEKKVPA